MRLVRLTEEKNKLLLTENTNSIFRIEWLITQISIDVPHYKTDYKCKSFVIINDKNEVIKYYNKHNHLEENHNAKMSLLKHDLYESIRKKRIFFGYKIKIYI